MSFASRLRNIAGRPYRTAGPATAATMLDEGALLIDVREPSEFRSGHAADARNIPLGQIPARLSGLPRGRTLVLVCQSGARSRRAARMLAVEGFDVVNLAGGMTAWSRSGLEVIPGRGRTGSGRISAKRST